MHPDTPETSLLRENTKKKKNELRVPGTGYSAPATKYEAREFQSLDSPGARTHNTDEPPFWATNLPPASGLIECWDHVFFLVREYLLFGVTASRESIAARSRKVGTVVVGSDCDSNDVNSGYFLIPLKIRKFVNFGLEYWGSDQMGVNKTRRFLLEWLSFTCRYIPVGVLEVLPQRINEKPPPFVR